MKKILINKQRSLKYLSGLIAEGRDMGTAVFPDAVIKFFLDADLEVRVQRRAIEFKKKGYHVNYEELFMQMKNRDESDRNRLFSPLCIPKNAIILDSTYMTLSEVIKSIIEIILKKIEI
ncbi:(d)CMP kinase [Buchnera aphidicola]|nr:(d)CMP kinase [Buchnera aphidicola]